jgi:hypothetical protein
MSIVLNSSGGGSVTINEPTTASNFTQTLPAATGDVMVSGNMPAFSATRSATQAITATVWTKVQFNTEEYDTASAYDNVTNYRFTPQVAGYYQVTVNTEAASAQNYAYSGIYKNGSVAYRNSTALGAGTGTLVTALVYLNGSTDYIEAYVNFASSINLFNSQGSYFQACLVRSA